jgi:predicted alpha/beta superfamily hydrolase
MARRVGRLVVAVVAGAAVAGGAAAVVEDGAPVVIGSYRTIHSKVLGEDRTVLVHLPEGYSKTTASYPVVYMLYGDHVTTYFAQAVVALDTLGSGGRIPECVLVGIMNTDRYRDLLPEARGGPTGIDDFLRFLDGELFPWVEKELRTKPFRVLVGPQAGGNFALYALMERPGMFDAFIIENPFRWRGGRELLVERAASFFAAGAGRTGFLHVTWREKDELETESLPYLRDFVRTVEAAGNPGFRLVLDEVPVDGEFLVPFRIGAGLRELFDGYPFPDDAEVASLDDILGRYRALSVRVGFQVDAPERVLAAQGHRLTERGETGAAVEVLGYMLERNPTSLDALWQLGNLAERAGRPAEAVAYYERMVALMGSDAGMIARRVEQLKAQIGGPVAE